MPTTSAADLLQGRALAMLQAEKGWLAGPTQGKGTRAAFAVPAARPAR